MLKFVCEMFAVRLIGKTDEVTANLGKGQGSEFLSFDTPILPFKSIFLGTQHELMKPLQ